MLVKKLLTQFFDAYLIRRDLEEALGFFSDEAVGLGADDMGVAGNKEELKKLMISQLERIPQGVCYEIKDCREKKYREDLYGLYANIMLSAQNNNGSEMISVRMTATAAFLNGFWRFVSLHLSVPSDHRQKDIFPDTYSSQPIGRLDCASRRKMIETMMSMLPGGILGGYLEDGFPLYFINDTMLDYLGYTYEELVKETGAEMRKIIAPEDWKRVERTIMEGIRKTGEYDIRYRVIRKDGTRLWVNDRGHEIVMDNGRRAMVSVMLDINEGVQLQEKLWRETMEDALTGIFNRRGALTYIEEAMARKQNGAMFLIDIDNFKQMNDTYGHQTGDQILMILAQILKKYSRPGDVAARIGGDEFLLFLPGCTRAEVLEKRAADICRVFREETVTYDKVKLSVSIGVGISGEESDMESLFKTVDDRLYAVKRESKGSFRYLDI